MMGKKSLAHPYKIQEYPDKTTENRDVPQGQAECKTVRGESFGT